MPASAFPGWEGRKSQSSCRGLNSEFLLFEYFLVQKRSNFYVFIGQSRTPHTETWSASKDHTEPWPWLLENNNCSKIGDSPGNYSSLQTISSLAGVSANTLRAVYLQSIPSPAPVISELLITPAPGRWTSLWHQTTTHGPLPSGSLLCANHGPDWLSFPPRREGLLLLPEQPAGSVMKEIPQQ